MPMQIFRGVKEVYYGICASRVLNPLLKATPLVVLKHFSSSQLQLEGQPSLIPYLLQEKGKYQTWLCQYRAYSVRLTFDSGLMINPAVHRACVHAFVVRVSLPPLTLSVLKCENFLY